MRSNTGMRCRGSAVLVGSLLFLTAPAGAVVRHASVRVAADSLTAMPSANLKKPLHAQRQVRWSHAPTAAWQKLAAGGTWQAAWDRVHRCPDDFIAPVHAKNHIGTRHVTRRLLKRLQHPR